MLFFDIDHFQHYNRTNGHMAGDDLLRQLVTLVKAKLRDTDVVARVGGEEFVVMYPGAAKQAAMRLAEELRGEVERYPFPHRAHQPQGAVTISGGVATFPEDAKSGRTCCAAPTRPRARPRRRGGIASFRPRRG